MPELVQMNLSVDPALVETIDGPDGLRKTHGWTKRETVTTAVETLAALMKRHEATAKKATNSDVKDLFLKLARLMPAGLTDVKVEEARFSDGRAALVVNDDLVFAEDNNGDVMVARRDGSELGHVTHGRVEMLASVIEGEPKGLKSSPDEAVLN